MNNSALPRSAGLDVSHYPTSTQKSKMTNFLQWRGDAFQIIIIAAIFLILIYLWSKFSKRYRFVLRKKIDLPVFDVTRGHRWVMLEAFTRTTYCTVCESSIMHGGYCDSCGICADDTCVQVANRVFPCKLHPCLPNRSKQYGIQHRGNNAMFKHQWVRGNLPISSYCEVCKKLCGNEPRLCGLRCTWCQRTTHDECEKIKYESCDFGKYCNIVIPPNCLHLDLVGWRGRRHWSASEIVNPPLYREWSPLVVLANRKSGNQEGELILRTFRSLLNPVQVIDLSELPPERALQICHLLPERTFRILVCGGDGTVGWVLNAIDKLQIQTRPKVSILPLGTGNDLARVLGWGKGYDGENIVQWLNDIEKATVSYLDRWTTTIRYQPKFKIRRPNKVVTMNNYFSVGCDALLALNFHRQRESKPHWFTNRVINKAWYLVFGAKDVLEQGCKNLQRKIELELDGQKVDLPDLEGIVVLNISSWGAGVELWKGTGQQKYSPSSHSDNVVEIAGFYSSFHMARIQGGLADPVRLGQAKTVKLTIKKFPVPVQVDGEPWKQGASTVTINHCNQALMLKRSDFSV
ncbi:diacylglycerol kinase epsilon-like [Anneissia japonica]|uniref:diacylglycerol kinase epsilon-like n=1 Tax=Anneissia japonica TaxID=1529436 RepID=UPI0014257495|nr:diacylglycerol kinase epsilon-like [Anneissia japonica]